MMLKKFFPPLRLASLVALIFFFGVSIFSASKVLAFDNSFVTIINPVRGWDYWETPNQEPVDAVIAQSQILTEEGLSATWLVRPDAFDDKKIIDFLSSLSKDKNELGIFFEITPTLINQTEVIYPKGEKNDAHRYFLSGYSPKEREVLINKAFDLFKERFGFYPKAVGAWQIDAYSLSFMEKEFKIESALLLADQFSTDRYQVWGGWWGVPYYPSKYNSIVPAQTLKNKLNVVILQWAVRDPVNGYGPNVESSFSVQPNDYTAHKLDIFYFENLLKIYSTPGENKFGHLTVGLENEYDWRIHGLEFTRQLKLVAKYEKEGKLKTVTMSQLASWYKNSFPRLSPSHKISAKDPLGKEKEAIWFMDPKYRVGILIENGKTTVRDLRVYNEKWGEPNLWVKNIFPDFSINISSEIDFVRFPTQTKEITDVQGLIANLKKPNLPFEPPKIILFVFGILIFTAFIFLFFKNKLLAILLFLGTLALSLTMIRSGFLYSFGMGFWGPNGHDGVWHLALANQVLRDFPPPHPTFAGETLTNYHYLFDFILAFVQKITTIPAVNLYFQIFPVILALSLGLLSFLVGYWWQKNFWTGFWFAFLNYFAGSFGYLVTLWRYKEIGGESLFWSMQSISSLINPPFALSLVILLLGLYFLLKIKKFKIWQIIILSFLFGLLIDIKVYAGVVVLPALFVYSLFKLIKREKAPIIIFVFASLISLVTFLSINRGAGSLLVFKPFWFVHSMIESPDRLFLPRLALARYALVAGKGWEKLILVETIGLFLFLLGNLGTRIIGLWSLLKKNIEGKFEDIEAFFLVGGGIALILPLLFVQKGTAWNTIQFFYYFLFFANFYAALTLTEITTLKRKIKYLVLALIILLTIPTTFSTLKGYLGFLPPSTTLFGELEALRFLQAQPYKVVLTYPYSPYLKLEKKLTAPVPLYAYETTAYVSAFSGKPTYLEDEMNLEISGYDWQARRKEAEKFFASQDPIWARGFLLNNKIGYIFLLRGQKINLGENDLGTRVVFDNEEVRIYQVLW